MSFLNPLALIGLLAISIPLLIHLFSRKRLAIIPFSSLEFLKLIERKRMRWLRIRNILLLVIRMLAIAFLFLAMARPLINKPLPFAHMGQGETSALIILDNSFSMGLKSGGQGLGIRDREQVFDVGKKKALEIIDLLRDGDEGFLILASDRGEVVFEEPVHDMNLLRKAIREAPLSYRKSNLRPSLERALELLRKSKKLNREIFLITDLQKRGFQSLFENPLDENFLKQPTPNLHILPVEEEAIEQWSLDLVTLSDPLFVPQKPFQLRIQIQNHSPLNTKGTIEKTLRLFFNGMENLPMAPKGSREVSLDPMKSGIVSFPLQFDTPGYHTGYFEIGEDPLEGDNRRYFSFWVPEKVRVLLIEGEVGEGFYLERALSPSKEMGSLFLPKTISIHELEKEDLNLYHAVGLLNVKNLSHFSLGRLLDFLNQGGGLFIALGDRVDIPFYAEPLLHIFQVQLTPIERTPVDKSKFFTLEYLNAHHPLFSVFMNSIRSNEERSRGDLSLVKFFRRHPLILKKDTRVIAKFIDGTPALVEGEKRSLLSTYPPTLSWSDFPLKALFVPFTHRLFLYLSQGEERRLDLLVGETFVSSLDSLSEAIRVETPTGESHYLLPTFDPEGKLLLHFDETDVPGIYRLHDGERVIPFSTNVDPEESDLTPIEKDELNELLKDLSPNWILNDKPLPFNHPNPLPGSNDK